MRLMFLRHGKAEERSFPKDDYSRRLTPEGILKLERDMPILADYISKEAEEKKISIFTSPILRARETADILHKYLPTDTNYIVVESLASGDLKQLKKEFFDNDAYISIAVGHNPFFDIWASKLVDADIPFKKGQAVELIVEDIIKWRGNIKLNLPPGKYKDAILDI